MFHQASILSLASFGERRFGGRRVLGRRVVGGKVVECIGSLRGLDMRFCRRLRWKQ